MANQSRDRSLRPRRHVCKKSLPGRLSRAGDGRPDRYCGRASDRSRGAPRPHRCASTHVAPAMRVSVVAEAAASRWCLHATDPASVYLSAWARVAEPSVGAVERALYDDARCVRMLAMRRTMFVVPAGDAPLLHTAASVVVDGERTRQRAARGAARRGGWQSRWRTRTATLAAGRAPGGRRRGGTPFADVPALGEKVRVNVGKHRGRHGPVEPRAARAHLDGKVVRGRPRGTWISSQYRWAPRRPGSAADRRHGDPAEARVELVRRWLAGSDRPRSRPPLVDGLTVGE